MDGLQKGRARRRKVHRSQKEGIVSLNVLPTLSWSPRTCSHNKIYSHHHSIAWKEVKNRSAFREREAEKTWKEKQHYLPVWGFASSSIAAADPGPHDPSVKLWCCYLAPQAKQLTTLKVSCIVRDCENSLSRRPEEKDGWGGGAGTH